MAALRLNTHKCLRQTVPYHSTDKNGHLKNQKNQQYKKPSTVINSVPSKYSGVWLLAKYPDTIPVSTKVRDYYQSTQELVWNHIKLYILIPRVQAVYVENVNIYCVTNVRTAINAISTRVYEHAENPITSYESTTWCDNTCMNFNQSDRCAGVKVNMIIHVQQGCGPLKPCLWPARLATVLLKNWPVRCFAHLKKLWQILMVLFQLIPKSGIFGGFQLLGTP